MLALGGIQTIASAGLILGEKRTGLVTVWMFVFDPKQTQQKPQ